MSPRSYLLHLTLVADLIREKILFVQYLSKSRCMKSRKELDVASRTARTLADALHGASPVSPHRNFLHDFCGDCAESPPRRDVYVRQRATAGEVEVLAKNYRKVVRQPRNFLGVSF